MITRHLFDADTSLDAAGDGLFRAQISDRWNTFAGPNGGYILAICVRALAEGVAGPDPLAVSAHFLRRPEMGDADVRTELVRRGRRHSTAQASLVQDGKEIARVVATFTDLTQAQGRELMLRDKPALPSPEDAVDPMAEMAVPGLTIADRMEYRLPKLPGWATGHPSGDPTNEFWMRFKDGREPDTIALTFLIDAAAPAVLEVGEVSSSTLELTVHVRARPAPGWLACRHSTRYLSRGYHEEDVEIWDSGGTLVAQSRQLALLS